MKVKKLLALLLSGVLAASVLTGCGLNKDAVVATLDGQEITLGVANFAARLNQAQYDDFYVAYMGEDVWKTSMSGTGPTMEDNTKNSVISSIQDLYTLEAHMADYGVTLSEEENAAIAAAAKEFMADNSEEAIEALGATEEIVTEYLTLVTIQSKMFNAIAADADTVVSDEDANTSAYSYVYISKKSYTNEAGEAVQYTEEELAELAKTVEAFASEAEAESLDTAAAKYGYTVSAGTFANDTTNLDEAVLTALRGLTEEGQIADLVETDAAYYVLRLDALTDAEATAEHRETIISERQSALYTEVLDGWAAESEWELKEKVWEKVSFDNLFTTTVPTEAVETTEAVESTEN